MQPIDPADKRQPNVQIAASIRVAILTGELEPWLQQAKREADASWSPASSCRRATSLPASSASAA